MYGWYCFPENKFVPLVCATPPRTAPRCSPPQQQLLPLAFLLCAVVFNKSLKPSASIGPSLVLCLIHCRSPTPSVILLRLTELRDLHPWSSSSSRHWCHHSDFCFLDVIDHCMWTLGKRELRLMYLSSVHKHAHTLPDCLVTTWLSGPGPGQSGTCVHTHTHTLPDSQIVCVCVCVHVTRSTDRLLSDHYRDVCTYVIHLLQMLQVWLKCHLLPIELNSRFCTWLTNELKCHFLQLVLNNRFTFWSPGADRCRFCRKPLRDLRCELRPGSRPGSRVPGLEIPWNPVTNLARGPNDSNLF